MKVKPKLHRLADFEVPIPLVCHHCDCKLPKSTLIELDGKYVVAQDPKCDLLTPFRLKAA